MAWIRAQMEQTLSIGSLMTFLLQCGHLGYRDRSEATADAMKEMTAAEHRMAPEHPGTGIAHHPADGFPLLLTVAVPRANGTDRFCASVRALSETL